MVTLTDLLEAIIGDLPGADVDTDEAVQREDGSWLLDGMLPLDRLMALLELSAPLDDDEGDYHTLGGFVMAALGRLPAVGDHFDHKRLRFEVMDMDRNRVDRVLVQRAHTSTSGK